MTDDASDVPGKTDAPGKAVEGDVGYVVRYGAMRLLGVMEAAAPFRYGDEVVVRTDRGTETGTVLCEATPAAVGYLEETTQGQIVRRVGEQDREAARRHGSSSSDDLLRCQTCVDALRLEMELVDVERILGGERIVVYYLAEQRVDFRQLVRDLAGEFQTRIEMRQIGVRDEAKLLGDYGDCGRRLCCANHLTKMPPVSMKMAKLQKATLDPTKISGRCGRLKCCLRYEFDHYQESAAELPPVGSRVVTRDGTARVLSQDILAGQLVVETEDRRRVLIAGNDVLTITRGEDERPPRKNGRRKPSA